MVNPSVWVGCCLLLVAIPFLLTLCFFVFFLVFFPFSEMVFYCVGVGGEEREKRGNALALCYLSSEECKVGL